MLCQSADKWNVPGRTRDGGFRIMTAKKKADIETEAQKKAAMTFKRISQFLEDFGLDCKGSIPLTFYTEGVSNNEESNL